MGNPILYAIPAFFILILIEYLISRWMKRDVYRLNDSINDISTGMLQLLSGIFFKGLTVGVYIWTYHKSKELGIAFDIPTDNPWAWVGLFLGVDFCYYWFHRASHQMNAPWAAHVVHHQSEEYNLSVALRQSSFQSLFSWAFYIPLAVLGFPALMTYLLRAINSLYQFWIHTRLIGRMGPLEWVFNTPSHHRVHHARNVKYLDKNHAGTLIIWDRLFGTFMKEEEEPTYGVTKALNSWNPVWANFHTWSYLYEMMRRAPRWQDKIKIWFMPPAWVPEGMSLEERSERDTAKFDPPAPYGLKLYVLGHFAVCVVALTWFLSVYGGAMVSAYQAPETKLVELAEFAQSTGSLGLGALAQESLSAVLIKAQEWSWFGIVLMTLFITISLVSFGGLFEGARWSPLFEFFRLLTVTVALSILAPSLTWMIAAIVSGALLSALWLTLLAESRMHFLRKMEPLALDRAIMEFDEWQAHKKGREKFPVSEGDSASAIFAQRWGAPK